MTNPALNVFLCLALCAGAIFAPSNAVAASRYRAGDDTSSASEPGRPSRDQLMQRIITKTMSKDFAAAGQDVSWLADMGYEPPTDSLNAMLKAKNSPYRFAILERVPHCVNGPHGGGCIFACRVEISNSQTKAVEHIFSADVKVLWSNLRISEVTYSRDNIGAAAGATSQAVEVEVLKRGPASIKEKFAVAGSNRRVFEALGLSRNLQPLVFDVDAQMPKSLDLKVGERVYFKVLRGIRSSRYALKATTRSISPMPPLRAVGREMAPRVEGNYTVLNGFAASNPGLSQIALYKGPLAPNGPMYVTQSMMVRVHTAAKSAK